MILVLYDCFNSTEILSCPPDLACKQASISFSADTATTDSQCINFLLLPPSLVSALQQCKFLLCFGFVFQCALSVAVGMKFN